jgi:hypothetical protein
VPEGGNCANVDASGTGASARKCVSGTFCDLKFTDGKYEGTCKKPPAKGEPCTVSCATGLVCSAGICGDRKDVGAACNSSNECKQGLSCKSKKCDASSRSQVDGPCGTAPDGSSSTECADGLACVIASGSQGTCKARIPSGGACERNKSGAVPCERYLTCVDGTCQVEDANRCL